MNEQTKQKYVELQILNQEIEQIEMYMQQMRNQLSELMSVNDSLTEVSKVNKETSMLAPIGSGVFIKSKINKVDEVLMNVGSNTVVEKSIPGAKKIIEEQLEKLNELFVKINKNYNSACQYRDTLEHDIQNLDK
jgi:prefoldin alpha subunit